MLKKRFSQGLMIGCMMSCMALVQAESLLKKEQDYSLVPKMRFNIDLDKTRKDKYQLLDDDSISRLQTSVHQPLLNETRLDQYDATLFYPLGGKGASFDLGLNMKYIQGQTSFLQDGQRQLRNFSAAIPMVYATALFDLPFEGFSAGFEGKHHIGVDGDALTGFDYKAKFKYEWDEGFGLQGGWQHQQYSVDDEEQTTNFENKGPFLDFYLRF
jgi:outer membrane protein